MLTEKKIASLKPKVTRYLVCDGDHLYVEVRPNGEKSWIYRIMINGRASKKTLGRVGEVDLYTARKMRDELQERQRKVSGVKNSVSFAELAADWMERVCTPKTTEKHSAKQQSRLDRYVLPVLGNLSASEITAPLVLQIVRGIESCGYIDLSHDVAQLIGMILRYGISVGVTERDCVADLRGALKPKKVQHRATLTRREDIAGLMRSIDVLEEGPVKWGLMLCAYTFLRPSEVRKGVWSEIDLERAEWKIPPERMKMRRPHIVPLSVQSVALLKKALAYSGGEGYILPTLRAKGRPLSDMAFLAALRRIGYGQGVMSVHGFRSMASTVLNEHGWSVDAIERQLAHVSGNVREVYNYAQYLPERRRMVQWYADYLDALRDGKEEPPFCARPQNGEN